MQNKIEKLIKAIYEKWKTEQPHQTHQMHPDEETLVCFLEGRLSEEESERIKTHLLGCEHCIEAFSLNLKIGSPEIKEVPEELISRVKDSLLTEGESAIFKIILRLKDEALEIINTTGDILVGQELVPAPLLRSRSIKDFKDEVTILKDFKDIRVEVRIENKRGGEFNLKIMAKNKETQKILKDLRVTLIRDDLELESYLSDSGSVTFEHVLLGRYKVEISTIEKNLASILLDIKI